MELDYIYVSTSDGEFARQFDTHEWYKVVFDYDDIDFIPVGDENLIKQLEEEVCSMMQEYFSQGEFDG